MSECIRIQLTVSRLPAPELRPLRVLLAPASTLSTRMASSSTPTPPPSTTRSPALLSGPAAPAPAPALRLLPAPLATAPPLLPLLLPPLPPLLLHLLLPLLLLLPLRSPRLHPLLALPPLLPAVLSFPRPSPSRPSLPGSRRLLLPATPRRAATLALFSKCLIWMSRQPDMIDVSSRFFLREWIASLCDGHVFFSLCITLTPLVV
jgi:hypothetical protein